MVVICSVCLCIVDILGIPTSSPEDGNGGGGEASIKTFWEELRNIK